MDSITWLGKGLPQLSSCGPIEVWTLALSFRASRSSFRNYQVAAPLKFRLGRHRPAGGCVLPQLSSCGPIEVTRAAKSRRGAGSFRNYQVAAPLKCRRPRGAARGTDAFRNYQVAAPLKYNTRAPWPVSARGLPQLSSCGPIEVRIVLGCAEHVAAPSATIKLRPH